MSQLQSLLHQGTLQIHKDLPDAKALVQELQDFRVNHSDSGRLTFAFGGRDSHGDMVSALAMAIWRATRPENVMIVKPFPHI